jgi:hypothetical protein
MEFEPSDYSSITVVSSLSTAELRKRIVGFAARWSWSEFSPPLYQTVLSDSWFGGWSRGLIEKIQQNKNG